MFKRLAPPILASALVLAMAAVSPASAGGGGPPHPPHKVILKPIKHPPHHPPHPVHWKHGSHGWHWRHGSYGGTVYIGGGYVPEPYPVTGAACPANCLGKEYLQDGSVRFFDRCTQESAIAVTAPAPAPAPAPHS